MGYHMSQREASFEIDDEAGALAAIKALADCPDKMSGGRCGNRGGWDEKWFAWVTTEEFVNAETLADAFRAWRWNYNPDCPEDFYFEGEKLGDDEILFNAIAPFVKPGSYIEMQGEDGHLWRWTFDGEKMVERTAKIDWV